MTQVPEEPVATGDRREEVHYEPKPGQLVKARFTQKPTEPPPPDEHTGRVDAGLPAEEGPPVEDLAVTPPSPSVWDARPPEDDAEKSGNPTGH
ncbi:MAG: hypothetical protein JWQ52_334 [Phenylobacterium sp.]|jgi:hypothetical protein|nr:hypothetical protein [Phenylobacterium sp.]